MSSWKVAGQATDLTSDVEDLIIALLKANWTETDPAANTGSDRDPGKVYFGNDWWDDFGDYQVHVSETYQSSGTVNNGWTLFQYDVNVALDVFVRRLAEDQSDPQVGKIQREIERIIGLNPGSLGQGVLWGKITEWRQIPDPSNIISVWHMVGNVQCRYYKVKV